MSIIEKSGTLTYVDGEDNSIKLYPETKATNVDIGVLNGGLGNWEDLSNINDAFMPSITYGNGIFVAVDRHKHFYHSTDCIAWTKLDITSNGDLADVCYGDGIFVAVCTNGWIYHSTDGISWTGETIVFDDLGSEKIPSESGTLVGTDMNLRCVTYGNGLFVFAGMCLSGTVSFTIDSDNKATVSNHTVTYFSTMTYTDICYGNNKYIAVGNDKNTAGTICTSTDGISWISVLTHGLLSIDSVCYGMGRCVATSSMSSGTRIYYSNDSANSFVYTNMENAEVGGYAIAYANRTFILAATSGKSYVSNDGGSWYQLFGEHCGKDTTFNLIDMNDKFMLVNRSGKIQAIEFARDRKDMENVVDEMMRLYGNNIRHVEEVVETSDIKVSIRGYGIGRIVNVIVEVQVLNNIPGGEYRDVNFNTLVPISNVIFLMSPGANYVGQILMTAAGVIRFTNRGNANIIMKKGYLMSGSVMYILK